MKGVYAIAVGLTLILLIFVGMGIYGVDVGLQENETDQQNFEDMNTTEINNSINLRSDEQETDTTEISNSSPIQSGEPGVYHFFYPEKMKNGYYTMPSRCCTKCSDESWSQNGCCNLTDFTEDDPNCYEFELTEGYTEDFEIDADLPIISIQDMESVAPSDIPGKCYVGDCTQYNRRYVTCVYNSTNVVTNVYPCNKYIRPKIYPRNPPVFPACLNGKKIDTVNGKQMMGFGGPAICTKPKIIHLHYLWNDVTGYDPNVEQKVRDEMVLVNNYFNEFDIDLEVKFTEEKLVEAGNKTICEYINSEWETPYYNVGFIDEVIKIYLTEDIPEGDACGGCYPSQWRPSCLKSFLMIHELGHRFYCSHTGDYDSLGSQIRAGGAMSYGNSLNGDYGADRSEYFYECKIRTWLLAQNS